MIYEGGWINRMFKPTENKEYLVTLTDEKTVMLFEYKGEEKGWCHNIMGSGLDNLVLAWMPLPKPYAEGQNDKF